MSAIPACATISWTPSLRLTRVSRCAAIGEALAPMDEDRNASLTGELEDRPEALVVERERLRARMELDPPCSGIERTTCLLQRARGEIEARESEEAPFDRAACSSVRSLGAQKPGSRSGSSRQKTNAPANP